MDATPLALTESSTVTHPATEEPQEGDAACWICGAASYKWTRNQATDGKASAVPLTVMSDVLLSCWVPDTSTTHGSLLPHGEAACKKQWCKERVHTQASPRRGLHHVWHTYRVGCIGPSRWQYCSATECSWLSACMVPRCVCQTTAGILLVALL